MDDDEWRKPVSRVSIRWADAGDLPAIQSLMALAIERLQAPFLSPEQIAASHAIMGLDTQLIDDGTYIVAERDGIFSDAEDGAGALPCMAGITAQICVTLPGSTRRSTRQGLGPCTPIPTLRGRAWAGRFFEVAKWLRPGRASGLPS